MTEGQFIFAQQDIAPTADAPAATGDGAPSTQAPGTPPPATPQQRQGDPFMGFVMPLILVMVVFYFIMWRGGQKDRKRHEDMLKNLKRNDRVLTVGGLIGTVVDAREDEVVVKVDETNNVKVRFTRSAIKDVLNTEPART